MAPVEESSVRHKMPEIFTPEMYFSQDMAKTFAALPVFEKFTAFLKKAEDKMGENNINHTIALRELSLLTGAVKLFAENRLYLREEGKYVSLSTDNLPEGTARKCRKALYKRDEHNRLSSHGNTVLLQIQRFADSWSGFVRHYDAGNSQATPIQDDLARDAKYIIDEMQHALATVPELAPLHRLVQEKLRAQSSTAWLERVDETASDRSR